MVAADKDAVKGGPAFNDQEITSEYENEVHSYYGLEGTRALRGSRTLRSVLQALGGEHPGEVRPDMRMGDTETEELVGMATTKRTCAKPKAILRTRTS